MSSYADVSKLAETDALVRGAASMASHKNPPLCSPLQVAFLILTFLVSLISVRQLLDVHTTEKLFNFLLGSLSSVNHNVVTSSLETLHQVCTRQIQPEGHSYCQTVHMISRAATHPTHIFLTPTAPQYAQATAAAMVSRATAVLGVRQSAGEYCSEQRKCAR